MTFRFKVVCIDHVPHSTAAESPHLCLVIFPKFLLGRLPTAHCAAGVLKFPRPIGQSEARGGLRAQRHGVTKLAQPDAVGDVGTDTLMVKICGWFPCPYAPCMAIFTYKTGSFMGQMLVNIPGAWGIWDS